MGQRKDERKVGKEKERKTPQKTGLLVSYGRANLYGGLKVNESNKYTKESKIGRKGIEEKRTT